MGTYKGLKLETKYCKKLFMSCNFILYLIQIAIIISKILKCYTKAKCKAPNYSQALRHIRMVSRDQCPVEVGVQLPERPETGRAAVTVGFDEDEKAWKAEDQMD